MAGTALTNATLAAAADACGMDRRRARVSLPADFPAAVAVSATATTIPWSREYTRRYVFLFIARDSGL
jgi:hypothetical protein